MNEKLTIERSKWARGKEYDNYLWDSRREAACCLGHVCHKLGEKIPWEVMDQVGDPDSFQEAADPFSGYLSNLFPQGRRSDGFEDAAIRINDDDGISDSKREAKLIALFAKHNIDLTFVD